VVRNPEGAIARTGIANCGHFLQVTKKRLVTYKIIHLLTRYSFVGGSCNQTSLSAGHIS